MKTPTPSHSVVDNGSKLSTAPKFSRRQGLIIATALAAFGILVVFLTHAATVPIANIEGENMTRSTSRIKLETDTTASADKAISFHTPSGTASTTSSSLSGTNNVIFRAKGKQCKGSPNYVVKLDGVQISTGAVSATSWTDISIATTIGAGQHTVTLSQSNYYYNSSCARVLWADKLTFIGADLAPPQAAITSPAGGATLTGTVTVSANASDNVAVASVQFKLDGITNLGSPVTTAPYSYPWDTMSVPNGAHTLSATATDSSGNVASSSSVSVTVNNPVAVTPPPAATTPPVTAGCPAPYAATSPWNTAISSTPTISPNSGQYIASLLPSTAKLTSDPTQYADPVYFVNNSTPLVSISYVNGWFSNVTNGGNTLTDNRSIDSTQRHTLVPMPSGTPMTNGFDGHVILINTDTNDEWDVSRYTVDATTGALSASNIGHYNRTWSAVPPYDVNGKPYFIRGSGVPFLAGGVHPCEITQGHIDHAIGLVVPSTQPDWVYPVTNSDGKHTLGTGIPEGTHFQLDPSIPDSTIQTTWGCKGPCFTLAKAMQKYGLYVIDSGGRVKIEMEYEGTAHWNGTVTATTVSPIPLSALRALTPPAH